MKILKPNMLILPPTQAVAIIKHVMGTPIPPIPLRSGMIQWGEVGQVTITPQESIFLRVLGLAKGLLVAMRA